MADEFDSQYPQATLVELGKLALRLSRHKDTRRSFLKSIKTVAPDYQLPGDQQMEDLRAEIAERRQKDDDERRSKEVSERLHKQRTGLSDGTLLNGKNSTTPPSKKLKTR